MIKYIGPLTWAWIIILGGLMITPDGVFCIVFGPVLTKLLGMAGLVANQRATSD